MAESNRESGSVNAPSNSVVQFSPPLLFTILAWGVNFVAIKQVYHQISPNASSLIRWILMETVLVIICLFKGLKPLPAKGERAQIFLLGALSMGLYIVLFMQGMQGSTPAEGAIILACTPLFTNLFAMIVKQERWVPGVFLGAGVALCGVALVVFGGGAEAHHKWSANGLIFLSSFVWATSAVLTRKLVKDKQPLELLTQGMPGALVALLPFGFLSMLQVQPATWTVGTWVALLHVALLAGALGFLGFYTGVKQIGAASAMLYQYFVPLIAALFGYLVQGTVLSPEQFGGMALVLGGVGLAMKLKQRALLKFQTAGA